MLRSVGKLDVRQRLHRHTCPHRSRHDLDDLNGLLPTMCALRMRRDERSTSSLPFGLRCRFSDQDEMYTFTLALPEDRQVFVQERDLVGEYLLAHGISVEIEVVARVTTQLPPRRPLGYLPRKLLGSLVVAFGHAH